MSQAAHSSDVAKLRMRVGSAQLGPGSWLELVQAWCRCGRAFVGPHGAQTTASAAELRGAAAADGARDAQ